MRIYVKEFITAALEESSINEDIRLISTKQVHGSGNRAYPTMKVKYNCH